MLRSIVLMCCLSFSYSVLADHHSSYGQPKGMISMPSKYDVKTTADKLEAALKQKGMTLFARIDHGAGANSVGLELRPTELVIFGNPKVGTPLMQCAQSVAIDLPQKMLIWQQENGETWLSYNKPQYLVDRHSIKGCDQVLKTITGALNNFATAATK